MSRSIFISHSSRDDVFVEKLRSALEEKGLKEWVDSKEFRGGGDLTPIIQKEIAEARAFIVVISHDAFNSAWVAEETRYAALVKEARKDDYTVIPLLREGIELGALKWIFSKEAVAIRVKDGPLGIRKAVPLILAALGELGSSNSECKG